MNEFIGIAKALADPSRTRALAALQGRELCACQILELLELAPSTVSKHMSLLQGAGLVVSRKEGRWMYYRLPGKEAPRVVRMAIDWAIDSVSRSPVLRQDEAKLRRILKVSPKELCANGMKR